MLDYEALDKKRELAVALKRQHVRALRECFDPQKPESRPTPKQQKILEEIADYLFQYVMGGNQSGKSQTGGRVTSWFFQRNHPYLNIDELWPDEPIICIVVGRLNNQVEELWERKIRPFLQPGEWRENRQGGTLQYVENLQNGSKIIFATHNDPRGAREKLQSYVAHFVWLDELTDHLGIIEELQRRVQAKRGRMLVTFTPKIRAEAVKKFIETETPYSRTYKISMLDNPVYLGREEELMSQINALPESQRQTILYGDWYTGENAVFSFDPSLHLEDPVNYSTLWPHVVSVDPAASGLMGFSLWAAPDQHAARWWCVRSEYVKGAAPSDLVEQVERMVQGIQVIYRLCDTHETWFMKEASKLKVVYRGIPNKKGRKNELIAQLNQALANGRIRISRVAEDLAAELGSAQWSETAEDKIINASSYHLADTAQYFVDQMPKYKEAALSTMPFDHQMYVANKKRIANEAARKQGNKQTWRLVGRGGRTWRR